MDEEVGGFLWCVVGGRKQPYRWLLFALKSAGRAAGRGRRGIRPDFSTWPSWAAGKRFPPHHQLYCLSLATAAKLGHLLLLRL